jgi:hypothetical protein
MQNHEKGEDGDEAISTWRDDVCYDSDFSDFGLCVHEGAAAA